MKRSGSRGRRRSRVTGRDDQLESKVERFVTSLLDDGSRVACEPLVEPMPSLPHWFQVDMFLKGQEFHRKHRTAIMLSTISGLITILSVPSVLDILVYTKQSGCALTAYRRYLATILLVHEWYFGDIRDPKSNFWKGVADVRRRHTSASLRSCKAGVGRITQKDMSLTQFGFIGFVMTCPQTVGVHDATDDELAAFLHFWRTLGYLLAIEDKYNLCTNVPETQLRCERLVDRVFRPQMERSDHPVYEQMVNAMLDGLWTISIALDARVVRRFVHESLVGCEKRELDRRLPLSFIQSAFLGFLRFEYAWLLRFRLVRFWKNTMQTIDHFLTENVPLVAIFRFGYRSAFVRVFK